MSPGLDRIHIRNSRSIPVNRERKLDPAGATARRSDPEGPEARTGTRDCPWSRCPPACERPQDRTHYRPSLGSGPWKSKLLGHPCSVCTPSHTKHAWPLIPAGTLPVGLPVCNRRAPHSLHLFKCLLPSASSETQLSPAGVHPQSVSPQLPLLLPRTSFSLPNHQLC